MSVVGAVNFGAPSVAFLWHNVIGAVTVVVVGMLISAIGGKVGATKARRGSDALVSARVQSPPIAG